MANSKYEYVRLYEQPDPLPRGNWIVIRIDGRGFHRFSEKHNFAKPNDIRAIKLMNKAAEGVLRDVQDIVLGYGVSDEYSFVLHHSTQLYSRRASKLLSTVVSTFTAHYVTQWPAYFPESPLVAPTKISPTAASTNLPDLPSTSSPPIHNHDVDAADITLLPTGPLPTFDARAICYPRLRELRDYLSWRQVDCHINNLYNTAFWRLVQHGGLSAHQAEQALAGTVSADKNEMLWSRFGVNYNNELEVFRKGSLIFRQPDEDCENAPGAGKAGAEDEGGVSKTQMVKREKARRKMRIVVSHEDIIRDRFWDERPWLLVE